MTTGKTEVVTNLDAYERGQITLATERDRLEREVIEAAKDWRNRKSEPTEGRLFNAVCALESFEAEQKK